MALISYEKINIEIEKNVYFLPFKRTIVFTFIKKSNYWKGNNLSTTS